LASQISGELIQDGEPRRFAMPLPIRADFNAQMIVERTFPLVRPLLQAAKDWENLNRKALAFLRLASIRPMLRKLHDHVGRRFLAILLLQIDVIVDATFGNGIRDCAPIGARPSTWSVWGFRIGPIRRSFTGRKSKTSLKYQLRGDYV
jgi:hypothetical protein